MSWRVEGPGGDGTESAQMEAESVRRTHPGNQMTQALCRYPDSPTETLQAYLSLSPFLMPSRTVSEANLRLLGAVVGDLDRSAIRQCRVTLAHDELERWYRSFTGMQRSAQTYRFRLSKQQVSESARVRSNRALIAVPW